MVLGFKGAKSFISGKISTILVVLHSAPWVSNLRCGAHRGIPTKVTCGLFLVAECAHFFGSWEQSVFQTDHG